MGKINYKHIHEEFWLENDRGGYSIYHRYNISGEITWCMNYNGSGILFVKRNNSEQWFKCCSSTDYSYKNYEEIECDTPIMELDYQKCLREEKLNKILNEKYS